MIQTLFIAIFKAGIPVAAATWALIWWSLKNGHLDSFVSVKELDKQFKQQKKAKKDKKSKKNKSDGKKADLVHAKWLTFGGGFYGVVALLTYVVVELAEIRDFLVQFEGISQFFRNISFSLFLGLIIDSIMNFVAAIAWPWYWVSDIKGPHIWIWFLVAYGGYWVGARLALRQRVNGSENEEG